ncbi:class F sortase [Modestobacter versicolor]|uniref:class F sortase n=1 Tax=Modestobacter versicolor TaxID=429133 RepID=UPI0034DEDBB9
MRASAAVLVLGTVLAVGLPTAWVVTRPEPAAGAPVTAVLATTPATTPATAPPAAAAAPRVAAAPATPPPVTTPVPPVRLEVAGAGIDAPLDPVGVMPDGAMAIPEDVDRVGWYRFGAAPGAPGGTAVLAGHVDDAEQGLGVLAALRDVQPGAEVRVTAADGTATRWQVVGRELIEKQALPLDQLFQRAGPPRLVLVTCGGEFDPALRSYESNVVVVAEPLG